MKAVEEYLNMRHHTRLRRFALIFTVVIAAAMIVVARNSAAAASFAVFGPTSTTCDKTGQTVAAGYQGSSFGTELQGFWDNEPVYISFTFPDGRVFSPHVTDDGVVNTPFGLDGVIDMPPNFPWVFSTSDGGDYYSSFQTTSKWPYGCYTFSARGAYSNRESSGEFMLIPQI